MIHKKSNGHSYESQYDTGDLVVTPNGQIGAVDPSSYYAENDAPESRMHYEVKCGVRGGSHMVMIKGENLRLVNKREWWWHRNPNNGVWQIGRTNWYEWLLQFVASCFAIWAAFSWLDKCEPVEFWAQRIIQFIGEVRIITLIVGTYNNFRLNGKRPTSK